MLHSIIGTPLRLHLPNGWEFEPWFTGADYIEYTLTKGPHKGRHAIQHPTIRRPAPGVETLNWYEETGTTVHLTWHLASRTVDRWASVPRWLADVDMAISAGDNQDPEFREWMRQLAEKGPDMPRLIHADHGWFEVLD